MTTGRLPTRGKVTGKGWEGSYYGRGDRVDKRSMADKAGLKPGDFLLEVRSQGKGRKGFTMVGVTGWTTGRLY